MIIVIIGGNIISIPIGRLVSEIRVRQLTRLVSRRESSVIFLPLISLRIVVAVAICIFRPAFKMAFVIYEAIRRRRAKLTHKCPSGLRTSIEVLRNEMKF